MEIAITKNISEPAELLMATLITTLLSFGYSGLISFVAGWIGASVAIGLVYHCILKALVRNPKPEEKPGRGKSYLAVVISCAVYLVIFFIFHGPYR